MSSWPIRQGAVFGIFPPASPPPPPIPYGIKVFFYMELWGPIIIPWYDKNQAKDITLLTKLLI